MKFLLCTPTSDPLAAQVEHSWQSPKLRGEGDTARNRKYRRKDEWRIKKTVRARVVLSSPPRYFRVSRASLFRATLSTPCPLRPIVFHRLILYSTPDPAGRPRARHRVPPPKSQALKAKLSYPEASPSPSRSPTIERAERPLGRNTPLFYFSHAWDARAARCSAHVQRRVGERRRNKVDSARVERCLRVRTNFPLEGRRSELEGKTYRGNDSTWLSGLVPIGPLTARGTLHPPFDEGGDDSKSESPPLFAPQDTELEQFRATKGTGAWWGG